MNSAVNINKSVDIMHLQMILLLSGAACTCSHASTHVAGLSFGCFDSSDSRIEGTLDDEEVCYVDYQKETIVWNHRIPSDHQFTWHYDFAFARGECKRRVQIQIISDVETMRRSLKKGQRPLKLIYSKDEGMEEVENSLICFVNHFFPPSIKVKWTRNDVEVPAEDSIVRYLVNPDGTFRHISTLRIIPHNGDIYACTVEHEALQEPQTRFWGELRAKPNITVKSVKLASGKHPSMLVCSAYNFYPKQILITCLRDGREITSGLSSSAVLLTSGDLHYQFHSFLEYTLTSGETITCMVEHPTLTEPMFQPWDPSLPKSERMKVIVGATGLLLGLVFATAGLIYYKIKPAAQLALPQGQVVVPAVTHLTAMVEESEETTL